MSFARNPIAQFLVSATGRAVRIAAGIALIAVGLGILEGIAGVIVAVVGLVPLAAGTFDLCVISALFGGPFRGEAIRDAGRSRAA